MSASDRSPGTGITGGYTGDSLVMRIAIATLAGITWYNAIELVTLVFVTFSQYRGLYFWSLLISSSVGLIPYSIGFLLKFFRLTDATWLSVTFITIGWYCMVTGQSIVLYSRLHLVLPNHRVLRRVLAMIVVNAVILHVPTTVLTYGSNLAPREKVNVYTTGYNIMEKVQMTGFCLQEFVLSALYIVETIRMLRLDPDRTKRKIMYQLVAINLIIILMDIALLVVEYNNFYIMETMIKGVVYSVKLKLEFAVLGKLVHLVRHHVWKSDSVLPSHPHSHLHPHHHTHSPSRHHTATTTSEFPDFVDATRVTSDLTHAAPPPDHPSRRTPHHHPYMDLDDIDIAMFEHSGPAPSEVTHSWSGDTQISQTRYSDSSPRKPSSLHCRDDP